MIFPHAVYVIKSIVACPGVPQVPGSAPSSRSKVAGMAEYQIERKQPSFAA
jgi:hypothetical protein